MSVLTSDLELYGSANMPESDGLAAGGAVAFGTLIAFNDITPAGTLEYVSSSALDTAPTIATVGRDGTGVFQTESRTLNGTTPVPGGQVFERVTKAVATSGAVGDVAALSATPVVTGTARGGAAATASASATITLASTQGASCAPGMVIRITNNTPAGVSFQLRRIVALSGDVVSVNRTWATVPTSATTYSVHHGALFDLAPNQITEVRRPFYAVESDVAAGATRTYFEKLFVVNNNTATALTAASVLKQADPSAGVIDIALTTALNDAGTIPNRQTAPTSGITAFSAGAAPQTVAVPGDTLPSGATPNAGGAQGVWLRWTLTPGMAAAKTGCTLRVTGATT